MLQEILKNSTKQCDIVKKDLLRLRVHHPRNQSVCGGLFFYPIANTFVPNPNI
jgi:hypothetical protein